MVLSILIFPVGVWSHFSAESVFCSGVAVFSCRFRCRRQTWSIAECADFFEKLLLTVCVTVSMKTGAQSVFWFLEATVCWCGIVVIITAWLSVGRSCSTGSALMLSVVTLSRFDVMGNNRALLQTGNE